MVYLAAPTCGTVAVNRGSGRTPVVDSCRPGCRDRRQTPRHPSRGGQSRSAQRRGPSPSQPGRVDALRILALLCTGRGLAYTEVFRRLLPTAARPAVSASPSSRGLGFSPFKAETRVRIPLGTPFSRIEAARPRGPARLDRPARGRRQQGTLAGPADPRAVGRPPALPRSVAPASAGRPFPLPVVPCVPWGFSGGSTSSRQR